MRVRLRRADAASPAMAPRRCTGAGARERRHVRRAHQELLSQQLEVNHHRVQRVLDLVRDAGRQPSERRELARVPHRRLHLAQVLQVAHDQHDADELALRVVDRVGQDHALALLAAGHREGGRRSARATAGWRASAPKDAAAGDRRPRASVRATPAAASGSSGAHRRIRKQQLALRAHNRHGVLEMLDRRLEVRDLVGHLRPVGRDLRAHGVEERAELAELVLLIEIDPRAELALAQAGQAAIGSRGSAGAAAARAPSRRTRQWPGRRARSPAAG